MAIDASSSAPTPMHECAQDEGSAIVVGQQSVGIDDCNEQDSEVVRLESMGSGQMKCPGGRLKQRAQRTKTYKRKRSWPALSKSIESNKDVNFVPMRKRGRSAGSKSTKSDKDRKRGRPAGSKSAKSKMGRKPALAYSNSSDNEGERGKVCDFDPAVPDADAQKKSTRVLNLHKNYRVQGRYGLAFKRDSAVQEKFVGEYPSFTKCMVPSNVLRVFWLHLSSDFCRRYLPKRDAIMTLEDEDGQRDYANYLSSSYGLSGGWRRFATDHNLKVGDTVVFELLRPTKFKVYIRRENVSTTTDDDVKSKEGIEVTGASSSAPDNVANNLTSEEEVGDVDGMRSSNLDIKDLDGVPSFENFNIFIDGLLVNPELFPDHPRGTYYQLCRDRKALLHRNLPKKINPALLIGLIMETTNIAEGISASSSHEDLAAWKKILESFELMGMDVGFLHKRVNDLLGITAKSSTDQPPVECEGYEEVKFEKDRGAEKMRALKSKMATVKDAMRAVDIEMEKMESSVKKYAQAMRQMATAPW